MHCFVGALDGTPRRMTTVTILFRRRVRAGREADYEQWLAALQQASRDSAGYIGVETIRPAEGNPVREYVSIVRFASYDHLRAWEASGVRNVWLARLPPGVVEADAEIKRLDGLEFWFRPPGPHVQAPSPLKMTLVITPIVVVIASVTGPLLRWLMGDLHSLVRLTLGATIQVVLMTYVIMPRVTRWLRGWLFR
jgi:antibiotic biosynthesis monooxygenase (ABM) superfamily enzyme